jgi:hypothetical protein
MKARYGFVPDAVEIVLEPDNDNKWNGTKVGEAMVRTASVLAANGFRPAFVGPSTTSMANAVNWAQDMFRVPGAAALVSEISYHRYGGVSQSNLESLAAIARQHNTKTAMLEHIQSGVDDLYTDLVTGNASAWQQFTLAVGPVDGGGQYYQVINDHVTMASRTRYLRQYFYYVRMGARRVAATSTDPTVRVAAFQNPGSRHVVVIHTRGQGSIEIRGVAPGRYGANITTASLTASELGEFNVSSGTPFVVNPPGEGVLTVYRK